MAEESAPVRDRQNGNIFEIALGLFTTHCAAVDDSIPIVLRTLRGLAQGASNRQACIC